MEQTIKDKILEKIKKGEVKMKPKIYFVLRAILFAGIFILFLIFAFFFLSFIHFYLISSGIWYLPKFGFEGFFVLLKSLPWFLIILALGLILILEILSRKFSFSFKKPVLFSLFGIILIVFLGSFLFIKSNVHPRLLLEAKEGKIFSPISPMYLKYGLPKFKEFQRGIIERVSTSSIFIKRGDGEMIEVRFEKPLPAFEKLKEGEGIMIFGEKENGKISGRKMRKINDEFLKFERKMLSPHFKVK